TAVFTVPQQAGSAAWAERNISGSAPQVMAYALKKSLNFSNSLANTTQFTPPPGNDTGVSDGIDGRNRR
ncbi:MAG: hypothetical protein ACI855_003171, partial [Myxococcota bacterium]